MSSKFDPMNIGLAIDYLKFWKDSNHRLLIHSPFLHQFTEFVLFSKTHYPVFDRIEVIRTEMLASNAILEIEDFGAGKGRNSKRSLSDITNRTAKRKKLAEVLHKTILFANPEIAIELGTATGISTSYQSSALQQGQLFGLEGSSSLAKLTRFNLEKLQLAERATIIEGNFDQQLPSLLSHLSKVDYVFIDGNHLREPTIRYFEQCLEKAHNETIFIFDDIRWSKNMFFAWQDIVEHPKVTACIDLFFMGIVFIKKELSKECLKIRL